MLLQRPVLTTLSAVLAGVLVGLVTAHAQARVEAPSLDDRTQLPKRQRSAHAPALLRRSLPPLSWHDLADPTALAAEEESLPAVAALARQFNPGMALPTQDIWPVDVRYAWHDGSDLKARVISKE